MLSKVAMSANFNSRFSGEWWIKSIVIEMIGFLQAQNLKTNKEQKFVVE